MSNEASRRQIGALASLKTRVRRLAAGLFLVFAICLCNVCFLHYRLAQHGDASHAVIAMGGDDRNMMSGNHLPQPQASTNKARLFSIIDYDTGKVIGDPSFLLQYAIIGFPKCGTTALADWLALHPQIRTFPKEVFALINQTPQFLIYRIWTTLYQPQQQNSSSTTITMGYKNPLDIRAPHSLRYLSELFPQATLIVGIRHPVPWFESLHNFKVQNLPPNVHPGYYGDANLLTHDCYHWNETDCLGAAKGLFHIHLASLWKTSVVPAQWIAQHPMYLSGSSRVRNPVFLYEMRQLGDPQLRRDLATALQLRDDAALAQAVPRSNPDYVVLKTAKQQRRRDKFKIRICDDAYRPLRAALMETARLSSEWIRSEFMVQPDVTVSSPQRFEELLMDWMVDPCEAAG